MDFIRGSDFVDVEPEFCPDAIEEWLSVSRKIKKKEDGMSQSDLTTRAKKHLSALGWVFWYALKGQKRELRYKSPEGKLFYSLASACKSCLHRDTENTRKLGFLPTQGSSGSSCCNKGSPISTLTEGTDNHGSGTSSGKFSSEWKKRKTKETKSDVCVKKDEVMMIHGGIRKYARKIRKLNDGKDESSIMQLRRTEKDKGDDSAVKPGIGKSLVNLKKLQIVNDKANRKQLRRSSRRAHHIACGSMTTNDMNDDICSVCHCGGNLVLCDACPSAFHVNCLGLRGLPEEDSWFCPPCCCGICKSPESIDDSFITCEQCQTKFHFGCLEQEIVGSYKGWFCGIKCEQVFSSLQSLVGKEIRVGDDDYLVWRLLKPPDDDDGYANTTADLISKLHRAVKVIHDCFERSQDSFTGQDMVEDVIFARKSHLKRLDFSGFYTIVLEKNKRLISVATVRIFRDVVEVPLVATVMKYRKQGMCRALINELERQMADMGVYKMVLPAAASVLRTWTENFGFSVMEDFERMKLLNHSFLDFQGTVMCQKVLMRRPDSAKSAVIDESFECVSVN